MVRSPWLFVPCIALLAPLSCASVQTKQVGAGTWLLRCESSLAGCAARAGNLCREGGFSVVRGHSYSDLAGVEGNQIARSEHELVIQCGMPSEAELRSPLPVSPELRQPSDRAKELLGTPCVPGETQECIGPGACRGGQSCLETGTGFSACNCERARDEGTRLAPDGEPVPANDTDPSPPARTTTPPSATGASPTPDAAEAAPEASPSPLR